MPSFLDSATSFVSLPRVEAIVLSPDGSRAVLTIASLKKDGTGYDRSLWQIPADGSEGARRLTRSAKGESAPVFTATGDILFVSARNDADAHDDPESGQVWLLPASGGEARAVTRLAGGVSEIVAVADAAPTVILSAELFPRATTLDEDAALRAERKKHQVAAILHETYPVRYWDHDLGPGEPHLWALDVDSLRDTVGAVREESADEQADAPGKDAPTPYPSTLPRPRDLTPRPGRSAATAGVALTPDGVTAIAAMRVPEGYDARTRLVAIDTGTGAHTILRDEPRVEFESPAVSHDGRSIAYTRTVKATPEGPTDAELWVSDVDGANPRRLASDWDRWPTSIAFDADDAALIVTADDDGRAPIFRVPLDGGAPVALTRDDFAYSSVNVDRESGDLVALRSSWMAPPHPVRVARDGGVTVLAGPVALPEVSARIEDVETTAADGARVRGWLVLPEGASAESPVPLLLWIHGGPLASHNAWSWRWNPHLAVARGYAVLLPDPALSTGYGLDFIARGWNAWGAAPYTDLLAITDAVVSRDDIDETRTAALGGSFGGYMANWVAGHTDRFRAIVTHASLWAMDQFAPTTDMSSFWQSIFTTEGLTANSPHQFVDDIRTPMLVIHGDRDYRVPIGEGLRLWSDLSERYAEDDGSLVHKFLYFPDENHWILKPQHVVVWYETVFAFLAQHVLGEEWERPARVG